MELNDPQSIFFVKNSGDMILGHNKNSDEIVVSSDPKLFNVNVIG